MIEGIAGFNSDLEAANKEICGLRAFVSKLNK
jgi:hypothetical protein